MSAGDELNLNLQDGFVHDEVVVAAEGHEVARLHDVTTLTQVGAARAVSLSIASTQRRLTISIPALRVAQEVALPPTRPIWVGVSLNAGRNALEFRVQSEPFGYA